MSESRQLDLFGNGTEIGVQYQSLIERLIDMGCTVLIRSKGIRKVIVWANKSYWASASFIENDESDLALLCERLSEGIYNISTSTKTNNNENN